MTLLASGDTTPCRWTSVLLSEALLAHDGALLCSYIHKRPVPTISPVTCWTLKLCDPPLRSPGQASNSRSCSGDSGEGESCLVDFDLLDRIVVVSPCHPQARTGFAILTRTYEQRTPPAVVQPGEWEEAAAFEWRTGEGCRPLWRCDPLQNAVLSSSSSLLSL